MFCVCICVCSECTLIGRFSCSRCVWCFSFGKSYVSSFPVIWSFILTRFISKPWFIDCCCKSSSTDSNSQFRKKVWLHHQSNQGLRGWQRCLYCAPYCLGKITRFFAYMQSQKTVMMYLLLSFVPMIPVCWQLLCKLWCCAKQFP